VFPDLGQATRNTGRGSNTCRPHNHAREDILCAACVQTSPRSVDDWFANPDDAKAEIERALAYTGHRIAQEVLDDAWLGRGAFRSRENGQLEGR
jgi:hypothetical protein